MTKETALLFVPFLWALAAGQQLQLKLATGEWVDVHNPDFSAEPDQYRVKPAPRTVFMLYRQDGSCYGFRFHEIEAKKVQDDYRIFSGQQMTIVPFVEKL
jgi:hypothetical protein